ncbi:MAG: transposase [Planctomycetota bacterium]|jgi:putative transposase
MGKRRYTEKQIAMALRESESGTLVTEIVRKCRVSKKAFYRWKRKFAGLGVAEVRRLKQVKEYQIGY